MQFQFYSSSVNSNYSIRLLDRMVAKFSKKLLKISFLPSSKSISKYTNIAPVTDYHSPGGNNLLHTHGIMQGTPIQGRQKAPSKRLLEERKPQHPLLFAAPEDSNDFKIGCVPFYHDGFATLLLERNAHLLARIIKHVVTVLFRAIPPISPLLRPRHEACPSFPACETAYCFFAQCHLLA